MLLRGFLAGTRPEPGVHDRRDPVQPCEGGCDMRSKLQMFGEGQDWLNGQQINDGPLVALHLRDSRGEVEQAEEVAQVRTSAGHHQQVRPAVLNGDIEQHRATLLELAGPACHRPSRLVKEASLKMGPEQFQPAFLGVARRGRRTQDVHAMARQPRGKVCGITPGELDDAPGEQCFHGRLRRHAQLPFDGLDVF